MIIAIMQPYFMPYIGYFQLMNAVDTFVILDDVQYITRGWINRNRILLNNSPHWITLPVSNAPRTLEINQRYYTDIKVSSINIENKLSSGYRKSAFYSEAISTVNKIINFTEQNVAIYNTHSLHVIASMLHITSHIVTASDLKLPKSLRSQNRIIAICQRLGATSYMNPIGGVELYNRTTFAEAGITLHFLKTKSKPYSILGTEFNLSILHDLFTRGAEATRELLPEFQLM